MKLMNFSKKKERKPNINYQGIKMKKNILIIFVLLFSLAKLYSNYTKIVDIHSASEYDYPPFCIVAEDSIADGFSVELLKATCEAMKINIDFKVGAWSKIKQELADGMIDVLPLVGRTPEREDLYDFTFPYLTFHGAVFAVKNDVSIKTLADLKNKSIIVLKGDNSEEYVKREKLSSKIISVLTSEDAFKALENGECDAVIAQKVMGLQLIDQLKLENIAPLNIKL
ncbi:MAG: transporter substrate-binding domain-containing protein, partial [Candidatus Delongbacteria bacterium]|nr:transporter substrate-binding domain-containing protein [Candidatus Delongbacteria bacterium]